VHEHQQKIVLSTNERAFRMGAAAQPAASYSGLQVLPKTSVGSLALGFRPFDTAFQSWHVVPYVGPANVVSSLYLTVGVHGPAKSSGTLHVQISGINCKLHCTTQTSTRAISPLPASGRASVSVKTLPWGCGKPVIEAWVVSAGRSSPVVRWQPYTACGE
jgi:hypothetical protein